MPEAAFPARLSRPSILLALTIFLGAAFRLVELGHVRHIYDAAYPAYDALRLLDGRQLLLVGQPSSMFLDNPPLMAYLLAIPLFFWRSLWSVYLFVALLNTAAIWFVARAARKLLGEPAALAAAFLFAVNPWVVHFSRMPWTQGLLPLFTAVFAWGFWPVVASREGVPRHLFLAMLALTAAVQSYILGFGLLLPVVVLSLLLFRRLPKRPLAAGSLVFLAGLILFALALSQNEARNSAKFQGFISGSTFTVNPEALEHAVRFVTGLDYEGQGLAVDDSFFRQALSRGAHILLSLALLAGGIQALLALRRGHPARRPALVLLVWFWAPVLGFLFLPYLVHPHYLMLSLPAGHLLVAWGLRPLLQRRRWRPALTVILLAVAGLFWLNLHRAAQVVAAGPSGPGFDGWALADAARMGREIRELTAGQGYPRRISAQGNSPLLSSISATYVETMPELEFPDFTLLPAEEPFLYIWVDETLASALLGPHQHAFPERTIQAAGGTAVSFLRVTPYDREQLLRLPQTVVDWTSDAGLTLLGYSLETPPPYRAGGSLLVNTYWRVEGLHPDRAEWLVAPFYHLLNPEGQIVANEGPHSQWGYRFQVGDVYAQRVAIPLPGYLEPGEHLLAVGLSDPIHGARFSLNSPAGKEPLFLTPIQIDE